MKPQAILLLAALAAAAAVWAALLLVRFRARAIPLLLATAASLAAAVALAWGLGWLYCLWRPVYRAIPLAPDRALGWKMPPGLEFISTGLSGEFKVPVRANSLGFHDVEHREEKPPGVFRVALLGDSYVEAIQVPLGRTAARRLEGMLNAGTGKAAGGPSGYEVFNFGVGNFGVGQYLLAYEEYASRFKPDLVVAWVNYYLMERTVLKTMSGAGPDEELLSLQVRPTFRLDGWTLVKEPARDYEACVALQQQRIEEEFGGRRMRLKSPRDYLGDLLVRAGLRKLFTPRQFETPGVQEIVSINMTVLDELNLRVKATGGRLAILDGGVMWHMGGGEFSRSLKAFAASADIAYFRLDDYYREKYGSTLVAYEWPKDKHFNELGNENYAAAIAGEGRRRGWWGGSR